MSNEISVVARNRLAVIGSAINNHKLKDDGDMSKHITHVNSIKRQKEIAWQFLQLMINDLQCFRNQPTLPAPVAPIIDSLCVDIDKYGTQLKQIDVTAEQFIRNKSERDEFDLTRESFMICDQYHNARDAAVLIYQTQLESISSYFPVGASNE